MSSSASRPKATARSRPRSTPCAPPASPRCTSSRTRRGLARSPNRTTRCRRRKSGSGAPGCARRRTKHASHIGGRRSGATISCSSTARAAATATTTRPGSSTSRDRSARSCLCGAQPSRTRGYSRRERGLPLLQALPRRRPHGEHRRLRRHPRHQSAGGHPPARDPRAAHRFVPPHRRVHRRRGQADARLHRRSCCRKRADGLPCRRECRRRGRTDDLPPALARAERRTDGEDGVSLIAAIEDEIKEAMKARDAERRDALRLIVNALKGSEKELQRPLSEDEELQVLQRERKKRVEATDAFRAGGREEQAAAEERELAILKEFMPEPLSEEEIEEIIDDAIAEVGATSMADLGRVMADVMPQVAGRADGSSVSQIVREKLA